MTTAPRSHILLPPVSYLSLGCMASYSSREDRALAGLCGLSFSNCQAPEVTQHSTGWPVMGSVCLGQFEKMEGRLYSCLPRAENKPEPANWSTKHRAW